MSNGVFVLVLLTDGRIDSHQARVGVFVLACAVMCLCWCWCCSWAGAIVSQQASWRLGLLSLRKWRRRTRNHNPPACAERACSQRLASSGFSIHCPQSREAHDMCARLADEQASVLCGAKNH